MKIFALIHTQADGALPKASLETLAAATQLNTQLGGLLTVGVLGAGAAAAADTVAGCGASAFLAVGDEAVAQPRYATDTAAATALIQAEKRAAAAAERKARTHELCQSAGLMGMAGLVDKVTGKPTLDRAELLGALLGLAASLPSTSLRVVCAGLLGLVVGVVLVAAAGVAPLQAGWLFDRAWHLVLPVIAMSYGGLAFLAKLTRASLLDNLAADYARTARAKGVDEEGVLWRHVFRNSLLPLITVSAGLLPSLLAGSVIVESIFSIDGMGKLAVEAVGTRDRELVLSITLISGLLTLAGYLLADIAYAIADPRVSYD